MTLKMTGTASWKRYRCTDCGAIDTFNTNHYGEVYPKCRSCGWKRPMEMGQVHVCVEPLPKGWTRPAPWKKVRLDDVAKVVKGKAVRVNSVKEAHISRTSEKYYVLKMGEREIGGTSVSALIRYAKKQGVQKITRSDNREKTLKVTHGLSFRDNTGGKKSSARWYVGARLPSGSFETFRCATTPTQETHGKKYQYVIGPFRTKNGALIMARYGKGNPHLQTVYDAEKMAKQHPDLLTFQD